MEWNQERCLELIDEYEKFPQLWNPRHGYYYHKLRKNDAWIQIAAGMDCTTEEAKKKMESLLASLRREKNKGSISVGTGKGRKDIYVSKWFAFKRFSFIMDRDDPKNTVDSLEDENSHAREGEINIPDLDDPEDQDDPDEPDIVDDQNNHDESTQFEILREEPVRQPQLEENRARQGRSPPAHQQSRPASVQPKPATSKYSGSTPHNKGNKRKKQKEDPRIEEAFQILKKSTAPTPPAPAPVLPKDDAFSIYGKYIADKLRGYDQRHRVMAEHEINNVIFTYDMKELNSPAQSLNSKNVRSSASAPTPPSPTPTPSPSVFTSGSDSRMSLHSPSIINENTTFNYGESSQVSPPFHGNTFVRLNPTGGNCNWPR